jgi:diguanylate cyclase (GGDEF)-like protein
LFKTLLFKTLVFEAIVCSAAVAIVVSRYDSIANTATTSGAFWLLLIVGVLAGTQSFVAAVPPGRAPMVICPTICFTFAIQLCWGLGPAIAAQTAAVVVVALRLRSGVHEAVWAAGQIALAFSAASIVLWLGDPYPFHPHGPRNVLVDAMAVVGAVLVWLAAFGLLGAVRARLRGRNIASPVAQSATANQVLFNAALLMLGPVLAVTARIDVGFVPLVFIPLYAVHRMAKLSAERDLAARLDPLTGLANRTGLRHGLDVISAVCASDNRPLRRATLLVLDLDRFKQVNDALGHEVGDQLLIAVAQRLRALRPERGTVARLGGDEFAILTATCGPDDGRALAERVVRALSEPVNLDGLRVDVTASVGIANRDDERVDFTTLMRHADIAMYDAKQRGDAIAEYRPAFETNSPERLQLLTDFRRALETGDRDEISMHYQPQVCLTTGVVEGVEALLRWRHPTYGLIDTQELLAVAEHSSVIHLLTMRAIDDVVAQVAVWRAHGIDLRASINVSSRDLYSDDIIVAHLSETLAHHEVDPRQIQIEITESALIADPSRAIGTVNRVCALGVAIALDDFGTGYSSLQHLRKLPIAEIKIDRTFVGGMADNHDDAAIVRSTVDLARSLGIRTVAEGVETEYTRQLLAEAGCTLAQGWLTAHPMPADEVSKWLLGFRTSANADASTAGNTNAHATTADTASVDHTNAHTTNAGYTNAGNTNADTETADTRASTGGAANAKAAEAHADAGNVTGPGTEDRNGAFPRGPGTPAAAGEDTRNPAGSTR